MPKLSIAPGKLSFTVSQRYNAPLENVWNAATQAKHLPKYFTGRAKGDISSKLGAVEWWWKTVGSCSVAVTACKLHESYSFHWKAHAITYHTVVRFEFKRDKGKTVVRITERGWKKADVASAFDHCSGWSEYLYGLKAYVQHGIDLRK